MQFLLIVQLEYFDKKVYDEKKYIFVEKILHICEAILKKDSDIKKIIFFNKSFLNKYKIKINLKNSILQINGKKFKIKKFDRNYLWKNILPILRDNV